jgi:hypothetical protein
METVNFPCVHCGNLMAVGYELLGQQVRCPHCQLVVQAPAAPAPAPIAAEPAPGDFAFKPIKEEESIFSPPELGDDIFGDPNPPKIEMPPEPTWPGAPAYAASPAANATEPEPPVHTDGLATAPTVSPEPAEPLAYSSDGQDAGDPTVVLPPMTEWPKGPAANLRPAHEAETGAPAAMPPVRRRSVEGGKSSSTSILIFLIPYAAFMTFVAIYFYFQSKQVIHPLEMLPNVGDEENPGVTKKGQQKLSKIVIERWKADTPLPANLRVPLHNTIHIGALQVTPERVARGPLEYCYDSKSISPEKSRIDALILTLHLKNNSSDQSFFPTDRSFNAKWRNQPKPYTYLEVGSRKFYGGPLDWPSGEKLREFIRGQEKDNQPLEPGEERSTVICTDASPEVIKTAQDYRGPILWRVRLRRGLVPFRDREVSVSAVIGVEFSTRDIVKLN